MVLPTGPMIPGMPNFTNSGGQKGMGAGATAGATAAGSAATASGVPGFLSEAERNAAANDPSYAIAAIRRAKTGGKRDMSGLGEFREASLGQALRAFLAMQMPNSDNSFVGDPVAQANQGLADIVAGALGGGYGGVLRNQAANLLGQDFSGLKDPQIYKMLAAAQAAAGEGYGEFAQYAPENALEELQNTFQQHTLGGGTENVLSQPGALNAFQQLLQQYLGTR